MTITRGFNFGSSDQVTDVRLYSLVQNATFTNVPWAAYFPAGVGLVGPTLPAAPVTGNVWWAYEPMNVLTGTGYTNLISDFDIFIRSPQGTMALFRQNAMEAKLFQQMDGGTSFPGRIAVCNNIGGQTGVTLQTRLSWGASGGLIFAGQPYINWIGTNWNATISTGPSISGFPRITLMGVALAQSGAFSMRCTAPYPGFLNMSTTGGEVGQLNASCASGLNTCVMGVALNDNTLAVTYPIWLFGAPVFRNA